MSGGEEDLRALADVAIAATKVCARFGWISEEIARRHLALWANVRDFADWALLSDEERSLVTRARMNEVFGKLGGPQ